MHTLNVPNNKCRIKFILSVFIYFFFMFRMPFSKRRKHNKHHTHTYTPTTPRQVKNLSNYNHFFFIRFHKCGVPACQLIPKKNLSSSIPRALLITMYPEFIVFLNHFYCWNFTQIPFFLFYHWSVHIWIGLIAFLRHL